MTEPHALAYSELRTRVTSLVGDVDPADLERPAAATPGWRVRDVLAHLVGVSDDIVSDRRDGIASDEWTGAQVDRRRDIPITELIADWERFGPGFEELLAAGPAELTGQALFDAATHEHDLRQAVARPGARASTAMQQGWDWFVDARTRMGAPAIRFVTERSDDIAGVGDPRVTVRALYFELFRATTGRRTAAEMERYEWEPAADVEIILAAPFFTIRTESLGE